MEKRRGDKEINKFGHKSECWQWGVGTLSRLPSFVVLRKGEIGPNKYVCCCI